MNNLHHLNSPDAYSRRCQEHSRLSGLTDELAPEYFLAQLSSESGEVLGKFAKAARDRGLSYAQVLALSEEEFKPIYDELGDVLFQVTMLARLRGKTLQDIADINLEKLARRELNGTIAGSGDDR